MPPIILLLMIPPLNMILLPPCRRLTLMGRSLLFAAQPLLHPSGRSSVALHSSVNSATLKSNFMYSKAQFRCFSLCITIKGGRISGLTCRASPCDTLHPVDFETFSSAFSKIGLLAADGFLILALFFERVRVKRISTSLYHSSSTYFLIVRYLCPNVLLFLMWIDSYLAVSLFVD